MWKSVTENDRYEVHSSGIVRRKDTKRVLKGCITSGYRSVKLTYDNSKQKRLYVHRLVAIHFIENSDIKNKIMVNHKNGNKLDNRVENLEWVTPRENNLHYYRNAKAAAKEKKNGGKAIPVIQYTLSGKKIAEYSSMNQARKATGVSLVQIARCVHGETQFAGEYIFKRQ